MARSVARPRPRGNHHPRRADRRLLLLPTYARGRALRQDPRHAAHSLVMPNLNHAVVIAGAGPTGLMLAGELALARVDVVLIERRADQSVAGSRAGGLHARTIEV